MKYGFRACALAALMMLTPAGQAAGKGRATAPLAPLPAGTYTIDKAHTSLVFRVSHLRFSRYTASFTNIDGQLQFDPAKPEGAQVTATIDPTSLDLGHPPAGFTDMLLGKDWLNAIAFPQIIFRSTKVELIGRSGARITGELSLHGITHPIVLQATFNGGYAGNPMDPHARIGFSAHGSLKRSDFGVSAGIPAPGSNMGVGDEVDVTIETEFNGPPATATAGH